MKLPWGNGGGSIPDNEKSVPRRSMKLKQAMMMMKNYKAPTYVARGLPDVITARVLGAIVTLSFLNSMRYIYIMRYKEVWA